MKHRSSVAQPVHSTSNKTFSNATHPYYQHKNFIQNHPTFWLPLTVSFVVLFLTSSQHVFVERMTGPPQMAAGLYHDSARVIQQLITQRGTAITELDAPSHPLLEPYGSFSSSRLPEALLNTLAWQLSLQLRNLEVQGQNFCRDTGNYDVVQLLFAVPICMFRNTCLKNKPLPNSYYCITHNHCYFFFAVSHFKQLAQCR